MDETAQPQKVDRRIVKTRRPLHEAIRRLIIKDNTTKISVSELAHEADIDRKTFYLHYASIEELIQEEATALVDRITDALLVNVREERTPFSTNMKAVFSELVKIADEDIDLYTHVFATLPTNRMTNALYKPVYDAVAESNFAAENPDKQSLGYLVRFYIAGTMALFTQWFKDGRSYSLDAIADMFDKATLNRDPACADAQEAGAVAIATPA